MQATPKKKFLGMAVLDALASVSSNVCVMYVRVIRFVFHAVFLCVLHRLSTFWLRITFLVLCPCFSDKLLCPCRCCFRTSFSEFGELGWVQPYSPFSIASEWLISFLCFGRFNSAQMTGASVILVGIGIVLSPFLTSMEVEAEELMWAVVFLIGLIPAILGNVYKQLVLGNVSSLCLFYDGKEVLSHS